MQAFAVVSLHKGSGSSTVLVNLASGLVRRGKKVLIVELGLTQRLRDWIGASSADQPLQPVKTPAERVVQAKFGLDSLVVNESGPEVYSSESILAQIEKMGYDFVLINPASSEGCRMIPSNVRVLVCTDLQGENEPEEIGQLLAKLPTQELGLIIPNRIETKEWDHNSRQLMALGDLFGYEKLADPVPT